MGLRVVDLDNMGLQWSI